MTQEFCLLTLCFKAPIMLRIMLVKLAGPCPCSYSNTYAEYFLLQWIFVILPIVCKYTLLKLMLNEDLL